MTSVGSKSAVVYLVVVFIALCNAAYLLHQWRHLALNLGTKKTDSPRLAVYNQGSAVYQSQTQSLYIDISSHDKSALSYRLDH